MPINEFGEFIGEQPVPENIKTPEEDFANLYDAFGAQSLVPEGVEKPDDTFYWKNERLMHYKDLFQKITLIVLNSNLTEVVHPTTGERISQQVSQQGQQGEPLLT